MDLNSIIFAVLFIVLGGALLVFFGSLLAYKVRGKSNYKPHSVKYQTKDYYYPKPVPVPVQQYSVPEKQFQNNVNPYPPEINRQRVNPYPPEINRQRVNPYPPEINRQRVNPYTIYTN
jgi:hypothetical protein